MSNEYVASLLSKLAGSEKMDLGSSIKSTTANLIQVLKENTIFHRNRRFNLNILILYLCRFMYFCETPDRAFSNLRQEPNLGQSRNNEAAGINH